MDGHQLSVHDDPRLVEVLVDGTVVAASNRTVVLDETGLPPRYYFPRDDVHFEFLEATPTETVCPFKGQASYWSVTTTGDAHRDVGWAYKTPLPSVEQITGRLCFYAEKTEHRIDGEVQTPPVTPWTAAANR